MRVFVPTGYDGIGGVYATLAEAGKVCDEDQTGSWDQVDEFEIGVTPRVASYTRLNPQREWVKWEENGKRVDE